MNRYRTALVEITDTEDDVVSRQIARDVRWEGNLLNWTDADAGEDTADKEYEFLSVEADGIGHVFTLTGGEVFLRVRDLDPYDAVERMNAAGVPQPLAVVQAEALAGGGVVAQELSAVIAPDNTVVTLLLETGVGTYVRYSGDWQLLSAESAALEDMGILTVAPAALDVWDRADMAQATLSAFDLPRMEHLPDGRTVDILPEPHRGEGSLDFDMGGIVVASGVAIPVIASADDVDVAVKVAQNNPSARWYVAKRAKALGVSERVPADWFPQAVVRPF